MRPGDGDGVPGEGVFDDAVDGDAVPYDDQVHGSEPYDDQPYDAEPHDRPHTDEAYEDAGYDAAGYDDWQGDDGYDDWDDPDVVYVPDEPGILRRGATIAAVFAIIVVAVVGAGAFWVRGKLDPSGPNDPVTIVVPPDSTTAQIANLLEDQGVISDATVFRYYLRWRDAGPFQAGTYDGLTTNQSMSAVVARLEAGPLPPSSNACCSAILAVQSGENGTCSCRLGS